MVGGLTAKCRRTCSRLRLGRYDGRGTLSHSTSRCPHWDQRRGTVTTQPRRGAQPSAQLLPEEAPCPSLVSSLLIDTRSISDRCSIAEHTCAIESKEFEESLKYLASVYPYFNTPRLSSPYAPSCSVRRHSLTACHELVTTSQPHAHSSCITRQRIYCRRVVRVTASGRNGGGPQRVGAPPRGGVGSWRCLVQGTAATGDCSHAASPGRRCESS